MPKAQKGPLQNQVTAFQCYKIPSRNLCPPYGNHHQLPTVIDRHKTTHDQLFWRLHLLLIFYFQKIVLFTFLPKSELRLSGLSPFAATYRYAPMSMQLDSEMCGISFPGLAWALLRCIWDIVRQDKNQTNIDAQQNSTTKTCAL